MSPLRTNATECSRSKVANPGYWTISKDLFEGGGGMAYAVILWEVWCYNDPIQLEPSDACFHDCLKNKIQHDEQHETKEPPFCAILALSLPEDSTYQCIDPCQGVSTDHLVNFIARSFPIAVLHTLFSDESSCAQHHHSHQSESNHNTYLQSLCLEVLSSNVNAV